MPRYFASKYRKQKDLQTRAGEVFDNPAVTDAELWKEVGRLLKQVREDRGWRFPTDVYTHGGPHNNIVTNHERGRMSSVKSLAKHAYALDITIADLLRSVLDSSKRRLKPQAIRIAQRFDELNHGERDLVLKLFQQFRRIPRKPSSPESGLGS